MNIVRVVWGFTFGIVVVRIELFCWRVWEGVYSGFIIIIIFIIIGERGWCWWIGEFGGGINIILLLFELGLLTSEDERDVAMGLDRLRV